MMRGQGGFAGQGKKRSAPPSKGAAATDSTPVDARSVYFNGLPANVTESDVRAECSKYARVKNVRLTNRKALVVLMTQEDAQKVGDNAVVGSVHATLHQQHRCRQQRNNSGSQQSQAKPQQAQCQT